MDFLYKMTAYVNLIKELLIWYHIQPYTWITIITSILYVLFCDIFKGERHMKWSISCNVTSHIFYIACIDHTLMVGYSNLFINTSRMPACHSCRIGLILLRHASIYLVCASNPVSWPFLEGWLGQLTARFWRHSRRSPTIRCCMGKCGYSYPNHIVMLETFMTL